MPLAPRDPSMTPARTREAWVDAAKGAAIVLVVLFHAGGSVPGTTTGGRAWEQVNVVLVSVRMPLFFLVSGLFVGRALLGPARRYLRRRVWPLVYLFLLWALLYAGLDLVSAGAFGRPALDSLLLQGTLWYLAGLAVHLAVALALRGVPPALQIAGAAVLAVPFAVWLPFEGGGLSHIPKYLVFFLVGCHGRQVVTALVAGAGRLRTTLLVLACGALMLLAVALRVLVPSVQELQAVVLFVLLPLVAVPLVLVCCRHVAPGRLGRRLCWLGRHTLPVFLLHPLALQLLDVLGGEAVSEDPRLAWVLPPLLTVGALVLSGAAWHGLEMYAPWLFAPTLHGSGRHTARRRRAAAVAPAARAAVRSADPSTPPPSVPRPRRPIDDDDTPALGLRAVHPDDALPTPVHGLRASRPLARR